MTFKVTVDCDRVDMSWELTFDTLEKALRAVSFFNQLPHFRAILLLEREGDSCGS